MWAFLSGNIIKKWLCTVSDGVSLQLLVRAGLAHPQRRRVSHAVRDGGASVLGLQQVEVVGHGGRVVHEARVHGEAVLVTRPRQLHTAETQAVECIIGLFLNKQSQK